MIMLGFFLVKYNSNATFGVSALLTNIILYISRGIDCPIDLLIQLPYCTGSLNGFDTIPCYFHTVLHELNEGFFF